MGIIFFNALSYPAIIDTKGTTIHLAINMFLENDLFDWY